MKEFIDSMTLTMTGGWALFGIGCIIYFIGDILLKIGDWIDKKFNK